jgi:hypothetical protein
MITRGQATFLSENVGTWFGMLLIGSFALLMGLLIWQTAFNENPIANAMAKTMYAQAEALN